MNSWVMVNTRYHCRQGLRYRQKQPRGETMSRTSEQVRRTAARAKKCVRYHRWSGIRTGKRKYWQCAEGVIIDCKSIDSLIQVDYLEDENERLQQQIRQFRSNVAYFDAAPRTGVSKFVSQMLSHCSKLFRLKWRRNSSCFSGRHRQIRLTVGPLLHWR